MNAPAMLMLPTPGNLAVAIGLAAMGMHVFPCQSGGEDIKKPHRNVFWRSQSTQDTGRIEAWWRQWPSALPAIDLAKSGLFVIDADRHGGPDGVAAWEAISVLHDPISPPMVATPGAGLHFYFRQPDGEPLGNREGALPPGINVRGHGGYVIGPGACLPDGRCYVLHGDLTDAEPAPDWLVEIIRGCAPPSTGEKALAINGSGEKNTIIRSFSAQSSTSPSQRYLEAAVRAELDKLSSAAKGASNNTLNEVSFALGTMAGSGWLSRGQAHIWLEGAAWGNDAIRKDGRPQMLATIRSGFESGMKSPRPLPENEDDALATMGAEIARAIMAGAQVVEEQPEPAEPEREVGFDEFPIALTYPGGLVGEMVDWIEATARYPSRAMALAAALSVLGTAMGREWCGPTEGSTTLYTLVLAPTGAGKDHILDQADKLMSKSGMKDIVGPGGFQSANGISSRIQRKPLTLCLMDEFGAFLGRVTHKNANSFTRDVSALLRIMWSVKFKMWRSDEFAQKAGVEVWAPAFNILGVSVPKEFYAALRGADIKSGFFNRFFVVAVNKKPDEREPLLPTGIVPQEIIRKLTYAMNRGRLADQKRNPGFEVIPSMVSWGEGGAQADADLKEEIAGRIEADEDAEDFYMRTREMALRIATIAGFGKNLATPSIERETMEWANKVALWSTEQMLAQYREYAAETEAQALAKEILRCINHASRGAGKLAHRDLIKALNHKYRAHEVKGALELLLVSGDINLIKGKKAANGIEPLFYKT